MMFTHAYPLFRLFGFPIKLDFTWFFLALLITWSLATGLFPVYVEGVPTGIYWLLGALGALGLFASIVLHELGHAVVARKYGIPISGITLFIFGGVAEMEQEPPDAKSELLMAIAGPIVSLALAVFFLLLHQGLHLAGQAGPATVLAGYLLLLNLILAIFNMIPAFPLDGGRVLRATLWAWKENLRWATRISSNIGTGFGIALIALGIFAFVQRNFIQGVWWFMIGLFMRSAAQMSYKQLLIRRALEGEYVRRFMKPDPVSVSPGMSIEELVEGYIYKFHYKMYPVTAGDRLVGVVGVREAREVPREEWPIRRVEEVMKPCSGENTAAPYEDAMNALSRMSRTNNSRLLVVDHGTLVGIVALKDMLAFLSLKMDLEGVDV